MGGLSKLALAGVFAAMAAQQARAADLFGAPADPDPISLEQPSELGSGWYLRADGGIGQDTLKGLGAKPNLAAWSIDLGGGYKFNNWLRADLNLDMRKIQNAGTSTQTLNGSQIICPTGTAGGNNALQTLSSGPGGATITELDGSKVTYAANSQIGYVWDPILGTCSQATNTQTRAMSLLLNGYVDIGTWSGFTPYVGAGVGVARLQTDATVNYINNANGTLYAPTAAQWTETTGTPLVWVNSAGQFVTPVNPGTNTTVAISTPPAWNRHNSGVKYNFAWNVMAGVAYAISDRANLDIGVRYLNMGNLQFLPGGPSTPYTAKEVRIGLRYQID